MEGKIPGARDPPRFESFNIGKMQSEHEPAGKISFRILCFESQADAVMGSLVKQLQDITYSKIRVEEPRPGSPERIITITANLASMSRVKLEFKNSCNGDEEEKEDEEVDVSNAQLGLLMVFEILSDGFGTGKVSCSLLTKACDEGSLRGNGGEILERIMAEAGCKVEIRTDNLPICADPDDALVQIEGNILAVKKAIVSISSHLQDCHKKQMVESRSAWFPLNASHKRTETIAQDRLSHRSSIFDIPSASTSQHLTMKHPHSALSTLTCLKILCPTRLAGWVIGSKGGNIKAMESHTGASIAVGKKTLDDCDERLIVVSAYENSQDQISPTQEAIVLVFCSICDGFSGGSRSFAARLVVHADQLGCLLGEGHIVFQIRYKTGVSSIQLLDIEQNPICVPENNFIVEILGEFPNVKAAIYEVTGRLRSNLLSISSNMQATPRDVYTTVEVEVPENATYFLHCNLEHIRQMSGARIIFGRLHLETNNRIIAISGTPGQIQISQNLIHSLLSTFVDPSYPQW